VNFVTAILKQATHHWAIGKLIALVHIVTTAHAELRGAERKPVSTEALVELAFPKVVTDVFPSISEDVVRKAIELVFDLMTLVTGSKFLKT
jgi:hypothetical protein